MNYKFINGSVCIARVYDKFNIKSGSWENRAAEYIYSALRHIGSPFTTFPEQETVTVEDYKAYLPCDIYKLNVIKYDGYRLPIMNQFNTKTAADIEDQYHPINKCELVTGARGYIITTFETGDVTFYYDKLPVELDKKLNIYFPLVPDNEEVLSAIDWYILMRILERGYKHPIYRLGHATTRLCPIIKWEGENGKTGQQARARVSVMRMNLEERDDLSNMINTFIIDYAHLERQSFYPPTLP